MATWVLVRHGKSEANVGRWLSGHRDVGLVPEGEDQARALVGPLAPYPFERTFSSDLRRAVDTARLALAGRAVQLEVTPALRERDVGAWTGVPLDQVDGWRTVLESWTLRPPGGESLADVARRAVAWLAAQPDGGDTLVVAHGGTLRALTGLLDGLEGDARAASWIDNAAPIVREVGAGQWAEIARRLAAEAA
jgi:broad specificity phosphatase PhoE